MTGVGLTKEQVAILRHAVGADEYGRSCGDRNFFGTDPACADGAICESLVAMGLMAAAGPVSWCDGETVYAATPEGIAAMREQVPSPPRLTRSQRRYREFLAADSGMRFREWLATRH